MRPVEVIVDGCAEEDDGVVEEVLVVHAEGGFDFGDDGCAVLLGAFGVEVGDFEGCALVDGDGLAALLMVWRG